MTHALTSCPPRAWPVFLPLLLVCVLGHAAEPASTSDTNTVVSRHADVQFVRSAPNTTSADTMRRFGFRSTGKGYNLPAEKFQIVVPGTFSTNLPWGLLVWISPGDEPKIPPAWEAELARQQLLFVGAYKSGNQRDVTERSRLALDAAFNMRSLYKIDPNRVYLAGMSGGGRMASVLGVAYADVFTGTICICGVDFYKDVPRAKGITFLHSYTPDAGMLARARSSRRFVLLTGELDFNRQNTQDILRNGFQREGFSHVLYLEVPGMKHALPPAKVLGTALEFLAGKETQPDAPPGKR